MTTAFRNLGDGDGHGSRDKPGMTAEVVRYFSDAVKTPRQLSGGASRKRRTLSAIRPA